jgi:hypothetical protein
MGEVDPVADAGGASGARSSGDRTTSVTVTKATYSNRYHDPIFEKLTI